MSAKELRDEVVAYWKKRNAIDFAALRAAIETSPEGTTLTKNFLLPHEDDDGKDYLHVKVFKTAEHAAYVDISQTSALTLGDQQLQAKLDKMFALFLE